MSKQIYTYSLVFLMFVLLVLIRAFEDTLFYDPFIQYFKESFKEVDLIKFDNLWLFTNHLLRYFLNTFFSLIILYLLFRDRQLLRFSLFLYIILFVILSGVYFYLINTTFDTYYLFTFYIRRFLIQPLLLIILIPAFYYQKRLLRNNEKKEA